MKKCVFVIRKKKLFVLMWNDLYPAIHQNANEESWLSAFQKKTVESGRLILTGMFGLPNFTISTLIATNSLWWAKIRWIIKKLSISVSNKNRFTDILTFLWHFQEKGTTKKCPSKTNVYWSFAIIWDLIFSLLRWKKIMNNSVGILSIIVPISNVCVCFALLFQYRLNFFYSIRKNGLHSGNIKFRMFCPLLMCGEL